MIDMLAGDIVAATMNASLLHKKFDPSFSTILTCHFVRHGGADTRMGSVLNGLIHG